jgi:nitrite reductase/ring-hydroxylating ferredoxin subunit
MTWCESTLGEVCMLKKELNDLVTQTGPGTAMGNLFRRYWHPALLSEQLPGPDCEPVRLELLSEKMLAFRDTEGKLGLIDEFCAHRGVSLWFGRNEQNGIRCPYHGWKYDVNGNCTEVPSEPTSGYCERIKLKSYPLVATFARVGICHIAKRAFVHVQARASQQLVASLGRWHRFQPRFFLAQCIAQPRSIVQRCQRQPIQLERFKPRV